MRISSSKTITESLQLMSEGIHEAAHAVVARVLPSPFQYVEGYYLRSLREIIEDHKDATSHVLRDPRFSIADIGWVYRLGDSKRKRRLIRRVYKNCITLMAGHAADAMFLRASLTPDERFDRFWNLISDALEQTDWQKPRYNDAEQVALYLTTIIVNEYGEFDEPRLNAIARGLYLIAHRAVERNWWCIKAVAGNSIYTEGISAKAVNYIIDRLAVGHRRRSEATPNPGLVQRVSSITRTEQAH
jgi:hypothetical protein